MFNLFDMNNTLKRINNIKREGTLKCLNKAWEMTKRNNGRGANYLSKNLVGFARAVQEQNTGKHFQCETEAAKKLDEHVYCKDKQNTLLHMRIQTTGGKEVTLVRRKGAEKNRIYMLHNRKIRLKSHTS
jgi:hypothetical protein